MTKSKPQQTTQARSEVSYDLGYLLAEIEELKGIATGRGLGTLAYLLECAALEAKWQVRLEREQAEERAADHRET
jgi:hypothetical protein